MRLHSLVLIAAIAVLGFPASALAESPADRVELVRNFMGCQQLYAAGNYASSLALCLPAISELDRTAREQNNPWYTYYTKATMMCYAAEDNSGLGHHREALRTALDAHRLARYVYINYPMLDPEDVDSLNTLIAQLIRIEARERSYIELGEGD